MNHQRLSARSTLRFSPPRGAAQSKHPNHSAPLKIHSQYVRMPISSRFALVPTCCSFCCCGTGGAFSIMLGESERGRRRYIKSRAVSQSAAPQTFLSREVSYEPVMVWRKWTDQICPQNQLHEPNLSIFLPRRPVCARGAAATGKCHL